MNYLIKFYRFQSPNTNYFVLYSAGKALKTLEGLKMELKFYTEPLVAGNRAVTSLSQLTTSGFSVINLPTYCFVNETILISCRIGHPDEKHFQNETYLLTQIHTYNLLCVSNYQAHENGIFGDNIRAQILWPYPIIAALSGIPTNEYKSFSIVWDAIFETMFVRRVSLFRRCMLVFTLSSTTVYCMDETGQKQLLRFMGFYARQFHVQTHVRLLGCTSCFSYTMYMLHTYSMSCCRDLLFT